MTRFEYVLPFVSILVGLAVADLFGSLHRLLRARARVRFHWLPLLLAALVLVALVQFWWAFYTNAHAAWLGNPFAFLAVLVYVGLLFLLAASVLPDAVPEPGLDLLTYYLGERRYVYTLTALVLLHAIVNSLVVNASLRPHLTVLVASLALVVLLAASGRVRVHAVGLPAFVALQIVFVVWFTPALA